MAGKGQKNIIGINKSYEWNEKGVDNFDDASVGFPKIKGWD
jgi:hypothetical protein